MKILIISILVLTSLSLAGCSIKKVEETGFLHDYSMLKVLPDSPETRYFETDCALWKKYKKVIVEPVVVRFTKDSEAKLNDVEIPEVQELADFFRQEMINVLKEKYEITTLEGPNVLRIRTAIVDVKPTNVVSNVISKALFYVPVDLGEAAIEGELADSITGERYAAIVDRKIGSMPSILGAYTEWGHTKTAFEDWATQLSELLREMLQRNTQSLDSFETQLISTKETDLILRFASKPLLTKHFATDEPSRISLDFDLARNGLERKFNHVNQGPVNSLVVAENGCKTRVIVQLKGLINYQAFIEGETLRLRITTW